MNNKNQLQLIAGDENRLAIDGIWLMIIDVQSFVVGHNQQPFPSPHLCKPWNDNFQNSGVPQSADLHAFGALVSSNL